MTNALRSRLIYRPRLLEPLVVALIVNLPVLFLAGHTQPIWLDGAWQISGVLIGIVIAFMVFQLQALGGQRFRNDLLYRVAVGRTLLLWPLTLALVFIAFTAIAARFEQREAVCPLQQTLALVAFCLQPAAVLAACWRLLEISSPQSTSDLVRAAIGDQVRRITLATIRSALAHEAWLKDFATAGVTVRGLELDDTWIGSPKTGRVHDFSRRLPRALHRQAPAKTLACHAELDSTTVHFLGAESFSPRERRLVASGIVVKRRGPTEAGIHALVADIVGQAYTAAKERRFSDLEEALGQIEELLQQYDSAAVDHSLSESVKDRIERIRPSDGSDLYREMWRLTQEIARETSSQATSALAASSYRTALDGWERRSIWLIDQALLLWRYQTQVAYGGGTLPEVAPRLHDSISMYVAELLRTLTYYLGRGAADPEATSVARAAIGHLLDFVAWLLKEHAEHGNSEAFVEIWRAVVADSRAYPSNHDVQDAEADLEAAVTADQRAAASAALDAVRAEYDANQWVIREAKRASFYVGAWLLYLRRQEKVSADRWQQFAVYLVGAYDSPQSAIDAAREGVLDYRQSPLSRWEARADAHRRGGYFSGAVDSAALDWLAFLLARHWREPVDLRDDRGTAFAAQLLEALGRLVINAATFRPLSDDGLATKASRAKEVLTNLVQQRRNELIEDVAAQPVRNEVARKFSEDQHQQFDKANHLRALLIEAGALTVDEEKTGVPDVLWSETTTKLALEHGLPAVPLGTRSAYRYQERLEAWIVSTHVENVAAENAAGIVDAVGALRRRGKQPTVLIPRGVYARANLAPPLVWSSEEHILGTIEDAPVVAAGSLQSETALVLDLADIEVRELRIKGNDAGLRIRTRELTVSEIAAALVKADDSLEKEVALQSASQSAGMELEASAEIALELERVEGSIIFGVPLRNRRFGGDAPSADAD